MSQIKPYPCAASFFPRCQGKSCDSWLQGRKPAAALAQPESEGRPWQGCTWGCAACLQLWVGCWSGQGRGTSDCRWSPRGAPAPPAGPASAWCLCSRLGTGALWFRNWDSRSGIAQSTASSRRRAVAGRNLSTCVSL